MSFEGADGEITTIVFVDVEGSTSLIDRAGDDAGTIAVVRQLDAVRGRLVEYGGREVKSLGDGLMLTFSSPRRAVMFATATQRGLAGTAPRVRFGINTGEVIGMRVDPLGGAVNAAARIAGRAQGGEVLVSDVVRQLVANAPGVTFADRGRSRLKGFAERWHLWAAEACAPTANATGTVGRADERAALRDLITSTLAGTGQVVLLEGEAGIGKTHLLSEATSFATAAGVTVCIVVADEITRRPGALPHGLLEDPRTSGPHRDLLRELLLGSSRGGDPADLSYAITEASVDAVESLTGSGAALIVFEDAHWADDLSLTVLSSLVRRAAVSRFSIVISLRPAPRTAMLDRLVDLVAGGYGHHLRLGPLDELDVHALSAALTGAAPGDTLRERLHATAGNPLYVTELLRSLDDEGFLRIEGGIADVPPSVMPSSLRDTLVRRLTWLPTGTIELLRLASLLGTSFTLADVAAIAGRSVIDVAASLREASVAGLIIGDGNRLAFRHDLIREAVYDDMLPAIRRDLHRAAAQALASINAPTQVVARQYARGALPGDLEAVEWLTRAADATVPIAPTAAIDLYEEALALAPDLWPDRGRVQARMIEPLAWCGRFARAEEIAATVLASSPDCDVEFAAHRGLSAVYGNRGNPAGAIEAMRRACAVPDAPVDESIRLSAMTAQLQRMTGVIDDDEARRIGTETLQHGLATGDVTSQCLALQVLASLDSITGYEADATRRLRQAISLYTSGRVRHTSYLIPDTFYAGSLIVLDDLEGGLAAAVEARARYERNGALSQLPMTHMIASYAHYLAGRYDDAGAELDAQIAVIEDTGNLNFILYLHSVRARISLRRGDLAAAQQHLAHGFEHLSGGGSLFGADWLLDTQTQWLAATGDLDAALAVGELIWSQTVAIRFFYGYRERAVNLVRIATSLDRRDLAEEVTRSAEEGQRRTPATSAAAMALQCRGLLERDPERLLEAGDLLRTTPLKPLLAACCEDAAAVLTIAGRRQEAIDRLTEAAAIHAETEATGDSARVDRMLKQLGVRPKRTGPTRPAFGWDSLTPTETAVSELIAHGLTNPEIGTRLYISRRTVESHLAHIFRKLGYANRSQLAVEFTRRAS